MSSARQRIRHTNHRTASHPWTPKLPRPPRGQGISRTQPLPGKPANGRSTPVPQSNSGFRRGPHEPWPRLRFPAASGRNRSSSAPSRIRCRPSPRDAGERFVHECMEAGTSGAWARRLCELVFMESQSSTSLGSWEPSWAHTVICPFRSLPSIRSTHRRSTRHPATTLIGDL